MLSQDMAYAFDIVLWARVALGLELDPWQANLARAIWQRALLLCSRQSGKTTITAVLALHAAIFSKAFVLIVSPSQRQSAEMLKTITAFYGKLKSPPKLKSESVLKLEFENGSRIIAAPGGDGGRIRGYAAVDLVVIDEASRTEDDLIASVRPMLATTNGRLIALTTPAGKRGWYYEQWHKKDDDWQRVSVSAKDCPRITQEFLDEELKTLGGMKFSEEYNLAWIDSLEAVFPTELLEAAFGDQSVKPLWAY
jgi:Terminase large subunit, T4likevirus-type, N-terminal